MHLNLGRRALIAMVATLLVGQAARNSARGEAVELHSPEGVVPSVPPGVLPDVTLQTLDGTATKLQSLLGKKMVVNFWATWCIPCVAELPELDRLAAAGGVTVLVVSADHGGAAAVAPFLARHPISHATVLLDPGSDLVHGVGVFGFPTTLIVDAGGHVRGRLEGPAKWSEAAPVVERLTK